MIGYLSTRASRRASVAVASVISSVIAIGLSPECHGASDSSIVPHIEVAEIHTDNVALAPRGEETGDYVTEADLGFELRQKTARTQTYLDYRLQDLLYANDPDRDRTHSQLRANSGAELIENHFFLFTRGAWLQEVVSPTNSVSLDNIADSHNVADVGTIGVSPVMRYLIADQVGTELRYDYEAIAHKSAQIPDTDAQNVTARLDSGPHSVRLPWQIVYRHYRNFYDTGDQVELDSTIGELRYNLTQQFQLLARAGDENNRFNISGIEKNPHSGLWELGFEWTPNQRTSLELAMGRRFDHSTTAAGLRYQGRRLSLHADYAEDIFSSEQVQFASIISGPAPTCVGMSSSNTSSTSLFPEFFGLFGRDMPREFSLLGLDLFPVRTTEPFERHCGRVDMGLQTSRSEIDVGLFLENREFQISNVIDQAHGADARWRRHFTPATDGLLYGGWQRADFQNDADEETFRYVGIALLRALGPDTHFVAYYRRTSKNSNTNPNDYAEQILGAELRIRIQ